MIYVTVIVIVLLTIELRKIKRANRKLSKELTACKMRETILRVGNSP